MSKNYNLALATLGFVALILTACTSSIGLEEEAVASVQQAAERQNGLSTNGLSTNGLATNGLSTNGLSTNGLSTNGLSTNGLLMQKLEDSGAQEILKYIVGCALREGDHFSLTIDNEVVNFYGSLGLAPEWGGDTGSCTTTACQTWVSACVLARLNYQGVHMDISLRGDATGATQGNPPPDDASTGTLGNALKTTVTERSTYSLPEATYFGNLFPNPPRRYACTINGSTLMERVCGAGSATPEAGSPYAGCAVTYLGGCNEGTPLPRCDGPDTGNDNYGSFAKCRDTQGTEHIGSITVYRQP
jgi:hypothetical protein